MCRALVFAYYTDCARPETVAQVSTIPMPIFAENAPILSVSLQGPPKTVGSIAG